LVDRSPETITMKPSVSGWGAPQAGAVSEARAVPNWRPTRLLGAGAARAAAHPE
jgi:hypothetical protein